MTMHRNVNPWGVFWEIVEGKGYLRSVEEAREMDARGEVWMPPKEPPARVLGALFDEIDAARARGEVDGVGR